MALLLLALNLRRGPLFPFHQTMVKIFYTGDKVYGFFVGAAPPERSSSRMRRRLVTNIATFGASFQELVDSCYSYNDD